MIKTSEVLELAKLEIERGWCKFHLQDRAGNVCAVGAVVKVLGRLDLNADYSAIFALNKTTKELGWEAHGLVGFNNHRDTRKEDVVAVFEKTIAALQEQGK